MFESFMIISIFEFDEKMLYFVSLFFKFCDKSFQNLNSHNSFNRFFNLFLTIAHLVFLRCNYGLKECKISTIWCISFKSV